MLFQRYPDGGASWTWFIWWRHPQHSITWTHSLSMTRWRHWCGWRPRIIWDRAGCQRGYGLLWAHWQIEMKRQNEMRRAVHD